MHDTNVISGDTCAKCGEQASEKCGRCKALFYCSRNCQKAHWKHHKGSCHAPPHELDQYMKRAGKLLQDVFLVWAEQTYGNPVASVADTGKELIVYDGPGEAGRFYKFPHHLVPKEKDKKMLLSAGMCDEIVAYFKELVDDMLLETKCILAEQAFKAKLPNRRIRIITPHVGEYDGQFPYHRIMLVTRPDGTKQWVLDPTGYQYNQVEPTMDAKVYAKQYFDDVIETAEWGASKIEYDNNAKQKGNIGLLPIIAIAGTQATYSAIKRWEETSHTSFPKLLRESDDGFEKGRTSLTAAVKVAVEDFVKNADFEKDIRESAKWEKNKPKRSSEYNDILEEKRGVFFL